MNKSSKSKFRIEGFRQTLEALAGYELEVKSKQGIFKGFPCGHGVQPGDFSQDDFDLKNYEDCEGLVSDYWIKFKDIEWVKILPQTL